MKTPCWCWRLLVFAELLVIAALIAAMWQR